jgi:TrmH family RNA methyltransferase
MTCSLYTLSCSAILLRKRFIRDLLQKNHRLKKDIKWVRSLQQKKFRLESGCFVVEGRKSVEEGLRSDFELHSLYSLDSEWLSSYDEGILVTTREMEQMSSLSTSSPYLAVFRMKERRFAWTEVPVVLVLDGIADPGNLGTIVRTADWFGISSIVCTHDCVELYNPKVVQATMGSIFRVSIISLGEDQIASELSANDFFVVAADLGGTSLYEFDFNRRLAIIVGSESHGVRAAMRSITNEFVTIPRCGDAESLNASIAASLFMSEYRRSSIG